jgi:hypothetical protein
MNIKTASDLEFAIKMQKVIGLGGSSNDLQSLFPGYFGFDEKNSSAKALRIYKDLRPSKLRVLPKRVVAFSTLLKAKSNALMVSDYTKSLAPILQHITDSMDLTDVFVGTYEAWLNNFEEPDDVNPTLSFQQAFSIFRYSVNGIRTSNPVQFEKCSRCQSHFPNLSRFKLRRGCDCPYC